MKHDTISALSALIAYGAWAYWVNMDAGVEAALFAGLVQGGGAFVVTYISIHIVQRIYKASTGVSRFVLPVIGATLMISGSIFLLHLWTGTPNPILTMLPSTSISILFYIAWVIGLEKGKIKG